MRFTVLSLFCLLLVTVSLRAHAFLTIGESGDITEPGHYKLGVEPQLRLSNGSGGNLGIFVDAPVNEEWSWRGELGSGDTNFWATGSAKWIPIPDYQKQPALGVRLEASLGRDHDENFTIFRVAPLVSKDFQTEVGKLTPYVALPIGIWALRGNSDTISQFIIGSEGRFEELRGYVLSTEVGFNMSKAFTYLSANISYQF